MRYPCSKTSLVFDSYERMALGGSMIQHLYETRPGLFPLEDPEALPWSRGDLVDASATGVEEPQAPPPYGLGVGLGAITPNDAAR
jgi:hypothetical protein